MLAGLASQVGLAETTALRLASAFGGGIARRGQVCGVVSGALMALGMQYGHTKPDGREYALRVMDDFLKRFKSSHQTILCRDLIQCDLTTPEGRLQAKERDVHHAICAGLVRDATKIAAEILRAG